MKASAGPPSRRTLSMPPLLTLDQLSPLMSAGGRGRRGRRGRR